MGIQAGGCASAKGLSEVQESLLGYSAQGQETDEMTQDTLMVHRLNVCQKRWKKVIRSCSLILD
jgi:hypothetical protein